VNQRLHADDLVAHVQREEGWKVLSLPAIAENPTTYEFATPYGWRAVVARSAKCYIPPFCRGPSLIVCGEA
jgi:hypothetical protein